MHKDNFNLMNDFVTPALVFAATAAATLYASLHIFRGNAIENAHKKPAATAPEEPGKSAGRPR